MISSRHLPGAALLCLTFTASAAPLDDGFQNPPDSARPQTYWQWMNGNVTKEGITADLESMQRVGVGGAQIFTVDVNIPAGPVRFMSPEWIEMLGFAVKEAGRLGLKLCVHNSAGWSSSGGPWNVASNSMQQVTTSELRVTGLKKFSADLPTPPAQAGFYRDIAVLAFPTPESEVVNVKALVTKATTSAAGQDNARFYDGSDETFVTLPVPKPGQPQFVQLEFAEPFLVRSLTLTLGPSAHEWFAGNCGGVIQASDDGVNFRDVCKFSFPWDLALSPITLSLAASPPSARFYRALFTRSGDQVKQIPVAEFQISPRLALENLAAKAGFHGNSVAAAEATDEANPALVVSRAGMVDLTARLQPDGKLDWNVPPGDWTILRIGHTSTGAKNGTAPSEGMGLECDKFSKEALDAHWAGMMKTVLAAAGPLAGKSLNNALIDSYEVGGQNWTPKFRTEFQKRRGYDPLLYLPTFTGRIVDNPAVTERFLWDVRRTIADLFAENYYGHFRELCHQAGLVASIEPYTGPFESLQAGGAADIPMGEFWVDQPTWVIAKLPASIGHIYGRNVIGEESFTCAPGAHGRWQEDPYSLKALGDSIFCQGINRYIFHCFAMQPWTNRWPGMTMGQFGTHLDRNITWWEQGRAWMKYIARCQYLLQQGRFVADAAYFNGESAPIDLRVGNPALPAGYDYDGVNADVLKTASVQNGQLVLNRGMRYRVLILPPSDRAMTPGLLRRLRGLVAEGLTLVGAPPTASPSLDNYPQCDAEIKSLVTEMWGNTDGRTVTESNFGKGKVIWGQTMAQVFNGLNVKPDFEYTASSSAKLLYLHRLDGDTELYFVSNQQDRRVQVECTFRVSGKVPELWDAETGRIRRAPVWREQDGRTIVPLTLEQVGSVFVVFREAAGSTDHIVSAKSVSGDISAASSAPAWEIVNGEVGNILVSSPGPCAVELKTAAGKSFQAQVRNVLPPVEIAGPWDLSFPPNWGAPAQVILPTLASWTENSDNSVKYFSGTATYTKEIEIPADRLGANHSLRSLWLDLGEVKNLAEVFVNGQSLGILWKPPFRVDLSSVARPGKNKLEIKVTNLWPNRLIGDDQLPPDTEWNGGQIKRIPPWVTEGKPSPTGRLTFTTWHHWTKDMQPLESGLLGPVTLRTAEIVAAN